MSLYVYILAEDDKDKYFYHEALQNITGKEFDFELIKLRKGNGISEVRKELPRFLKHIQTYQKTKQIFFVVAVDNDRSPIHPEHVKRSELPKKDQSRQCHFCQIEQIVKKNLGKNPKDWPVQGAIVVPVEMLESWLLLISDKDLNQEDLPIFSRKDQPSVVNYLGKKRPDQLKDLVNHKIKELKKSGESVDTMEYLCIDCGNQLDPENLARRSSSFAQFKAQVAAWQFQ